MEEKTTQHQVYFNGKLVPEHEAKISIYDSALMLEIWFLK